MKFGADIPFVHHLGFELTRFDGGFSEITYAPKPEHLNSFGVTHGGACMTLLDVAMAVAARSVQPELGVVTIEMKTSFMQPAKAGRAVTGDGAAEGPGRGSLLAKGHLLHRTATLAFTTATLFDADGKACAHATGTFKYIKRLAVGPRSSHALRTTGGIAPENDAPRVANDGANDAANGAANDPVSSAVAD